MSSQTLAIIEIASRLSTTQLDGADRRWKKRGIRKKLWVDA